jgi:NADH-quinone oxidoreductase subunit N
LFLACLSLLLLATTGGNLNQLWVNVLIVMAILTMTVGNVVAIVQNNVKRMLAYSSIRARRLRVDRALSPPDALRISHNAMPPSLRSVLSPDLRGDEHRSVCGRATDRTQGDKRTEIEDYRGIGFESPALAFSLSLFMLSLLGMPLTAGFMGKVMVFGAAIDQKLYGLVVIGVLNTAVSAYYYLRLIIVMFFGERTMAGIRPGAGECRGGVGNHGAGCSLPRNFPGRVLNALKPGLSLNCLRRRPRKGASIHRVACRKVT